MREELFADGTSLDAGEVVVVPGRELVVTRALLVRESFVPPFSETPANALDPFFHLAGFCPCTPGLGRACDAILAQGEFWRYASIYRLNSLVSRRIPMMMARKKITYHFTGDELMRYQLDTRTY